MKRQSLKSVQRKDKREKVNVRIVPVGHGSGNEDLYMAVDPTEGEMTKRKRGKDSEEQTGGLKHTKELFFIFNRW